MMRAKEIGTMKSIMACLLTMMFAICLVTASCAEDEGVGYQSAIARYMKDYRYTLPAEAEAQIIREFEPQMVDCGQVQVRFEEMLYDGQWLYTVASVIPTDPAATLVLPGESGIGERMAGDDPRTYGAAAKEDGKEIIGVYAYPLEFEDQETYFVDHYQGTDGVTFLLSGAKIGTTQTEITVAWQIKLYHIDPDAGEYSLLQKTAYPMSVRPPQTYTEKTYTISDTAMELFRSVRLVQTPLNTYLLSDWEKENDHHGYLVTLLEADGHAVEHGAPPDMESYQMDALPSTLTISIVDAWTGGEVGTYELARDRARD